MGFFRKNKVVDLTEDYNYERKHPKSNLKEDSPKTSSSESEENVGGFFNWIGNSNLSSNSSSSSKSDSSGSLGNFDPETGKPLDPNEKRRRLAKRLKDMTDRIEELSNQVYVLQQKIEVLEKKTKTGNYDL